MTPMHAPSKLYRSEVLRFVAWGEYGLFTRPELRTDPVTQPVIPPTAAEGVVRSIFWHPESKIHDGEPAALGVEVREIWVLNPIQTTTFRLNEIKNLPQRCSPCAVEPQQTSVVVLRDPKYMIMFQYVSRTSGEMVKKAAEIFKRRLQNGQSFQHPCFGRRRYPAFVREAQPDDQPIDENVDLGNFPWRVRYADPSRGTKKVTQTFAAKLRNGVLKVPSYLDAQQKAGDEAPL